MMITDNIIKSTHSALLKIDILKKGLLCHWCSKNQITECFSESEEIKKE